MRQNIKNPYAVYQVIYDLIDIQDEDGIRQSTLWAVKVPARVPMKLFLTKCIMFG